MLYNIYKGKARRNLCLTFVTKNIDIMNISNDYTMLATVVGAIVATVVAICTGIGFVLNKFYKLGTLSQRFETLETDVAGLKNGYKEHHDRLNTITITLLIKHKGLEAALTQRNSPRSLNALGKEIYDMMNGDDIINANKDLLFKKIDEQSPKAALDVESASLLACASLIDSDEFLPVKKFVYNCPAIKKEDGGEFDVTLDAACYVLSFPLRDLYLAEHVELC